MISKLFFVNCINTKSEDFKELQSKYNLSIGELENALSVYQNRIGEAYDPNSKELYDFLNERYKIGSNNILSKRKDYDLFHRIWKQNNNLTFNNVTEAKAKYEQLKKVFGEDNVSLYTNSKGENTISIAEPLLYDKEMRDILSNAPRNEEGQLLVRPGGPVSNLTEMQYAMVRTKAFKEWFGDWERAINTNEIDALIDAARAGNAEAIAALKEYNISYNNKGVYRFVSQREIDELLKNGKITSERSANTIIDVTSSETPTTGAHSDYRITFKMDFDKEKSDYNRAVMKNPELGDGWIKGGYYTLEDVLKIEKRKEDGTYEEVFNNEASKVVDENGEPLVVYHQSKDDFSVFNSELNGSNYKESEIIKNGIFFSNYLHKNEWGNIEKAFFLNIKNPYTKLSPYRLRIEKGKELIEANSSKYDGVFSDDWRDIVIKNSNQIKSATSNNGEFSKENDNIYRQQQSYDINEELKKLSSLNRPLIALGSTKNIEQKLKSTNIHPILRSAILFAIEKNPDLKNLSPATILGQIASGLNKDLNLSYLENIQKPINEKLEQHLINYLSKYGIEVKEADLSKYGEDVTGVFDAINKVIAVSKDRNSITIPEEAAHAIVELMGSVMSRRPENRDFTKLMSGVKNTEIYKRVYEEYKTTYVKENGSPDIYKIKKEAIGQAIAAALVENSSNTIENSKDKSFFEKLKEFIEKIFSFFKNVEYLNFDSLVNKIANEVLEDNHSRFKKLDSSNFKLLDYAETLADQTKKDGGKAVEFLKYFSNLGNVITGSLSYRYQGTVYRKGKDSIHDIDMQVPQKVHNITLSSFVRNSLNGSKEVDAFFSQFNYFKQIKEKYPDLTLTAAYGKPNEHYLTVNAIYCKDDSIKQRFINSSGSYADRLEQFTQEEADQIYLMDFFLQEGDTENFITDRENGINLTSYKDSFREKLKMGRAKDIYDYQMFRLFDEYKSEVLSDDMKDLMFQKSSSQRITIEYTPKGKSRQTYTVEGSKIFNKEGKEVFKEDSVDRNKIFANVRVREGNAVVVNYKGTNYVVNRKGQIISTVSGKVMQWNDNNGNRIAINNLAKAKFAEKTEVQETKRDGQEIITKGNTAQYGVINHTGYISDLIDGKNVSKQVKISTTGYKKGDPQANPNINYVFTENAEANSIVHGLSNIDPVTGNRLYPYKGRVKVNVSDVNGTNQAGIRTDSRGNVSKNAFGIIVKHHQHGERGNFVAKEGQFNNSDQDYKLFTSLNEDMFARLEASPNKEVIFPSQMGLGKAALPWDFAKWLQLELQSRFGVKSELQKNQKPGYEGYGLELNPDNMTGKDAPMDESAYRFRESIEPQPISQQVSELSKEDQALMEQELGTQEQMKKVEEDKKKDEEKDDSATEKAREELIEANKKLAESTLLSAREKSFLANNIMSQVSIHISMLQNNPEVNKQMFGDEFEDKDFTSMSRSEIIKTIGIDKLLNFIKEYLFNPKYRDMSMMPRAIRKKYKEAYDNWVSLIEMGYPKLIATEGVSLTWGLPEGVTQEGIEEAFREQIEQGESEEKSKEYWQVGIRNIAVKASLSQDIRRMLEKLYVTDKEGNYIKDEFGFGLDTFVDSSEAVNSILDWCKDCTSFADMVKVLESKIDDNTWVSTVLEQIKKEPLRSQFYQNFRKDFTQYSIIVVKYEKGKRVLVNKIINTEGVTDSILDELTASYSLGEMQSVISTVDTLTGKGTVNRANIESLQKRLQNVYNLIKTSKSLGKDAYREAIENNSAELTSILKELGIRIDNSTVVKTLSEDKNLNAFNIEDTSFGKVNRQLKWMFNTLLKNSDKGRNDYNPMNSNDRNNSIYGNYKSILKEFEENVQKSIESSVYQDGKMYYSFVTPSYVGKLMRNLKDSLGNIEKFKEFMQDEYGQYRWFKDGDTWLNTWLEKLNTDPKAKENLDHKVQLTFDGVGYKELSPLAYAKSLIQEYFYNGTNSNLAWFHVPILSNKPSSEFIRFEAFNGADYKEQILKGLEKTFYQELLRMRAVLDRMNNDEEKIKNFDISRKDLKNKYDTIRYKFKQGTLTFEDLLDSDAKFILKKSGASFKFLDVFNGAFEKKTAFGQQILDRINGKKVDEKNEASFSKTLKDALTKAMNIEVQNELSEFTKMGLFEFTVRKDSVTGQELEEASHLFNLHSSFEDIYQRKFGKAVPKKGVDPKTGKKLGEITKEERNVVQTEMLYEMQRNMEKYIWNSHLATINIIQLTATDLAYYKNVEDFQKRYAQIHSPGLRLNVDAEVLEGSKYHINGKYSDGKFRTLYIKDQISSSEITDNIKAVFDRKIKALPIAQRPAMEIMRDKIINAFKNEVNVTDAQAYNSLTSMRKKLGMQGKWYNNFEKAYERVKEGNFNINDLNILMQPLKPFVYSQITKNSGSNIMKNLKVGVQYKNSEYLLFIAEALTRNEEGRPNKLKAIADFMEETAFDENGNYNGKGIDTIQFQSAVKVGEMGVVDITKANTYEEVKDILKAHTYLAEGIDTKESLDNYNANYVHTFNAEDFAVQQEVPAHMQDHQQQYGSQMRVLAINDINNGDYYVVNGEKISGSDLKNRYQELLAKNIQRSFDELSQELNLNGTKLQKNKALEKILRDAILNDSKYGSDLLKACTLNENGEFNIPLLDPIQSNRIQQLLNSIIKNRIYKQKVAGGPVVQVSSFGMSSKVNIVFKDKNVMSLTKFKEVNPEATNEDYKKYLEDSKAAVDHYECYITCPDSALEKSLTRIDENGNEYLLSPEKAVEQGIITKDILKGIAYRIPTENKYSMMPIKIVGFLPRAAGEAIILPEEITLITGSDFDIDKMYTMFKSITNSSYYKFKDYLNAKKAEWKNQKLNYEERKKKINELEIIFNEIEKGTEFSEDSYEMEIYDELQKYKVSGWRIVDSDSREGDNNKVFDLTWSVLTSEHTSDKIFNYGSFDEQKKTARIIQVLENGNTKYTYDELSKLNIDELDELIESSSNRNILHPTSQIYFHKQNMTAGKLIGIFANHNVSHGLLDSLGITLNLSDNNKFTFDGYTVTGSAYNTLDAIISKNGGYISKTIAGFVAASVDAVKDPVLNFMNLNTATAGTAMFLARMGFDSDSIGLFLTQPAIKAAVDEYFKINSNGFTTMDTVINEMINNSGLSKNTIKAYKKSLSHTNFTKNELAQGIANKESYTDFQIRSLLLFQRLSVMASKLNDLTFITKFNSSNNAVGPTIGDTLEKEMRIKRFLDYIQSSKKPIFRKFDVDKVFNIPIIDKFYNSNMKLSEEIFKDNFIQYNPQFKAALNKLVATTKGNIDAELINKFANEFVLYAMTSGENAIIDGSFKHRKSYIYGFPEYFKKQIENIKGNAFIDMIKLNQSNNKFPAKSLSMESVGQSIDLQQAIKNGWEELIKNPETKELAIHLFKYNIYRSGLAFSPKTFLHQASNEVKANVSNYIEFLRNITELDDIGYDEFLNQFKRNHSDSFKLVTRFNPNDSIKVKEDGNIISFSYKESSDIDSIIVEEHLDYNIFASHIMYKDKLYELYSNDREVVSYTEVTKLGNKNNALEYNAMENNPKTIFKNSSEDETTIADDGSDSMNDPVVAPSKVDPESQVQSNSVNYIDYIENSEALQEAMLNVFTKQELGYIGDSTNKTVLGKIINTHLKDKNLKDRYIKILEQTKKDLNLC